MNDARGEAIIMASGQGGKGDEEKGLFFKFFLLTSLSILPASSCARMTPALPEDASMMSPGGKPKKKKKRKRGIPRLSDVGRILLSTSGGCVTGIG